MPDARSVALELVETEPAAGFPALRAERRKRGGGEWTDAHGDGLPAVRLDFGAADRLRHHVSARDPDSSERIALMTREGAQSACSEAGM